MHKSLLATAALTIAVLFSACAPSTTPMPSLHGNHINVPAIPLPSATNIVLDAATVDAAGAAECSALGSGATSAAFFDADLGQWSINQLANVGGDLARQHALLGNAFVSGYFGGAALHAAHGALVQIPSASPFASISAQVNASTSVPVLDQLVGRVLTVANGNAAEVGTSVGLFPKSLGSVISAAQQTLAYPGIPADAAALLQSLVTSATTTLAAVNAGLTGDIAAGRRAEEAVTGIFTWAAGYYLGLTAPAIAAPTLSC